MTEPNARASLGVAQARWPKLHRELSAALGAIPGLGYAHDGLPGPLRILADRPLTRAEIAAAQAVVDAHDPTLSAAEERERKVREVARRHGLSPDAVRALAGDRDARQRIADELG